MPKKKDEAKEKQPDEISKAINEISEPKHEIKKDEKDAKIEELTELLQRVQADFENYKKRVDRDKQEFIGIACESMVEKLLPFVDSFELALANRHNSQEFVKGIELVYSQLWELLEKEGVQRIECVGKKFNPHEHEALLSEKSDKEENTIIEELQKGYRLRGRLLRHSKVKVAKK